VVGEECVVEGSGEALSGDPFMVLARHRSQTRLVSSPIATVVKKRDKTIRQDTK
jgi:hypothetical protein